MYLYIIKTYLYHYFKQSVQTFLLKILEIGISCYLSSAGLLFIKRSAQLLLVAAVAEQNSGRT
jgi:hypothetical protein